MNKLLLLLAALAFISAPVFAESSSELCATEAKDTGIEDAAEFKTYVEDCIAQMNEIATEEQNNSESTPTEPAVAITD